MKDEDRHSGRLVSRREVMAYLGATGAIWLTGGRLLPQWALAGTLEPSCVVRPEQTEGPYFVDEHLHRSDIRSDPTDAQLRPGTPLTLQLLVSRLDTGNCQPLLGAQVDIWHCDALGLYSDVRDPGFDTVGKKYLRGYQMTDARGEVRFVTVYPGWYPGRTVHIHFKIRRSEERRVGKECA